MERAWWVACVVALPGCYLAHGAPAARDADPRWRDAAVLDAGAPRDAGRRDAAPARDSGEAPIDPGPDGRPSDAPGAGEWRDPPPPWDDEPCCVAIGERDVRLEGVLWIAAAWSGETWGILAGSPLHFVELDAAGAYLGSTELVDRDALPHALVWARDRYGAIVGQTGAAEFVTLDRHGAVVSEPVELWSTAVEDRRGLVHLEHLDRWIASQGRALHAFEHDGRSAAMLADERANLLVGLRSRAVMWTLTPATSERAAHVVSPTLAIGPRIDLAEPAAGIGYLAVTSLRDEAIGIVHTGDRRWLVAFDPFTGGTDALPAELPATTFDEEPPRVALGLDEPGLVAVLAQGLEHGAELRIIGRDGLARGAPVALADVRQAQGCALAWSGESLLVACPSRDARRPLRVQIFRLAR